MKQVINYIENEEADYAIFINGSWGQGKTYYVQNELIPLIRNLGLKPFYYTVNGIDNSHSLHDMIISKVAIEYFDKRFFLKKIAAKFKLGDDKLSGILSFVNKINQAKRIFKFSNFFSPGEVVIILDDLERISPTYNYEDFFGYLNREFIEHGGYKLVLLGDTSREMISNSNFFKIREKYIRWSYEFDSDPEVAIRNLLQNYASKTDYYAILSNHCAYIIDLVKDLNFKNLRTIKFFLEVLENVILVSVEDHGLIIKDLIYSTLIFCFEYREGSLDIFDSVKQLPKSISQLGENSKAYFYDPLTRRISDASDVKSEYEKTVEDYENYFKRYTSNRYIIFSDTGVDYRFFPSIFKYLKHGILDSRLLKEELDIYASIKKPVMKIEQNENINSIALFRTLTEEELDRSIEKIVSDIREGKLSLFDFIRAFNFLIYLSENHIIVQTMQDVNDLLLHGISHIVFNENEPSERHQLVSPGDIDLSHIEKFNADAASQLDAQIQKFRKRVTYKDAVTTLEKWHEEENMMKAYRLILDEVEPKVILNQIMKLAKNRDFLSALTKVVKDAYRSVNAGEFSKDDISKLKQISVGLRERRWDHTDRIDDLFILRFIEQIEDSIEHLSKSSR